MNDRNGNGSDCEDVEMRSAKIRPMDAGKSYKVTVTAKPGTGTDPIDWDFESALKSSGSKHLLFDKRANSMKKWDYYLIEFILDDRTDFGLQFDPNPMEAFWVALGNNVSPPACPTEASYSDQIYAILDDPNGRSLTVRNEDDVVQFFRFSLGFVGSDGAPHRYDPVGNNMNGGSGRR